MAFSIEPYSLKTKLSPLRVTLLSKTGKKTIWWLQTFFWNNPPKNKKIVEKIPKNQKKGL